MAWFDALPLAFSEPNTKNALRLLKRGYPNPQLLQQVARLAGLDDTLINFNKPPALLPMEVMDQAAGQGRMTYLLAEVLSDTSTAAIHNDLWKLLGTDAPRIHAAALASRADFDRAAALPSPSIYAVNGSEGDLQRIVNVVAKFHDTALLRFELAQREARVARIELAGRGEGTGWLVGPQHVLTAYHVISKAVDDWEKVRLRLDYKIVPELGRQVLENGRVLKLAAKPLLAQSGSAAKAIEFSEAGPDASLLDFALLKLDEPVGSQGLGPDGRGDEERGWYQLPTSAHVFDLNEGLFVLGHPQLEGATDAGPMKLTLALPSGAQLTAPGCRVRYSVNTEGGSSGSPVMDQDLRPLALHHGGKSCQPEWDKNKQWLHGFNQGIPLHLIVAAIRKQVNPETLAALSLG